MPYRRTENVVRKLAARHDAIIAAARALAAEGGMAAVQIAPVAERAGIAAGTVYRYFPAKTDLDRRPGRGRVGSGDRRACAAPRRGARPAVGAGGCDRDLCGPRARRSAGSPLR